MNRLLSFIKKEIILCVAGVLAIASAFVVHPSKKYINYIEAGYTRKDGSKGSLYIKIFYIGKENGKPQFLFNTMDITKEKRKRVKQRLLDYMDSLSKLCSEILRLNYTDNTLTTVHCDENRVKVKYDNAPLDRLLNRFSSILDKDEHDEIMKVLR